MHLPIKKFNKEKLSVSVYSTTIKSKQFKIVVSVFYYETIRFSETLFLKSSIL